jgi:cupin 2 domain-containing protein
MEITRRNIFELDESLTDGEESFETLLESGNVLLEKITTYGKLKSPGKWYDQDRDEWVMLLQGNATIEFVPDDTLELQKGDFILIPAHKKHRVTKTSHNPDCIWLALHGIFH